MVEEFEISWSDKPLISNPNEDLIIVQPNGKEYPIKSDIFKDTYLMVELFGSFDDIKDYNWIKNTTTTLVKIPKNVEPFEIETLEGVINNVAYPDYVAIGPKGELYTNTKEFFDKNLEVVN